MDLRRQDGVEAAIDRAREIAGDKDVVIGGGAGIAQQVLRAGLVDELHLHVAPVILGAGRTLFGQLGVRLHAHPRVALRDAHRLPHQEVIDRWSVSPTTRPRACFGGPAARRRSGG